jgi:hypothetical protein
MKESAQKIKDHSGIQAYPGEVPNVMWKKLIVT